MKKLLLLLLWCISCMPFVYAISSYSTTATNTTISSDHSTWEENNVKWSLSYTWEDDTKTYFAIENDGLHIGSSSNYIKNVSMSTSDIKGTIKSITVTSRSNSSSAKLSVSVNGEPYLCKNSTTTGLTTTASQYTFEGNASGEIVINVSNTTTHKNIYLKKVVVKYDEGTITIGDLSANCNGKDVESPLSIEEGTAITFHAENATSFSVTVDGEAESIVLPATNGSATWTPAVCSDAKVSVTAIRDVEGETQQQTETPLTFTLTVTKVDYVIANWVVTSAPSTTSGQKVNVDLILDSKSSPGKWHAYAPKSYSSGINGGAQLGSKSAPFNDGTITLLESEIPANAIIREITFTGETNDSYTLTVSVNEVSAGTINVAQDTKTDHKLSNLNLIGNKIVFTATSASKYLCVNGFSIKYTIPEPEPDPISVSYTSQFCFDASENVNANRTELMLMAGTELTFSSTNATTIGITSETEITNLPESVAGEIIKWAPEAGEYTITVTASNEKGSKQSNYYIYTEEVTPSIPEIVTVDNTVMVSCTNGALMIKIDDYVAPAENAPSMLAADVQDWTFSEEGTKDYTLDCSTLADGRTILLSAKAVTPKTESEVVQMYFNNQGVVAGIENVAVDAENGKTIYYDLQGRRVNADRPGMYIRQQGAKAEKVVIR